MWPGKSGGTGRKSSGHWTTRTVQNHIILYGHHMEIKFCILKKPASQIQITERDKSTSRSPTNQQSDQPTQPRSERLTQLPYILAMLGSETRDFQSISQSGQKKAKLVHRSWLESRWWMIQQTWPTFSCVIHHLYWLSSGKNVWISLVFSQRVDCLSLTARI